MTNVFFATVNQVFGDSSQLLTTVKHVVMKSLTQQYSDNETVLGSSRKLGGAAKYLIDGSEKPSNCKVRMLLKGAVSEWQNDMK